MYVRPGAILTLNKEKVQHSGAQGGALEVQVRTLNLTSNHAALPQPSKRDSQLRDGRRQVYTGADGMFTLFEDDGETLDYKKPGGAAVRKTNFTWLDSSKTLSWAAAGTPSSGIAYKTLEAVFFAAGAAAPSRSASTTIGDKGSVKMP